MSAETTPETLPALALHAPRIVAECRLHELKTWPAPFAAVLADQKKHEVRKRDRDFQERDLLWLREWDPATGAYTGWEAIRVVTHITFGGAWGLPADVCVMSIRPAARWLDTQVRAQLARAEAA